MDSISIASNKLKTPSKAGVIDKIAKRFVQKALNSLFVGQLTLEDNGETLCFGQNHNDTNHVAHIKVNDNSFYRDIFFNSSIGAGEAYMRGSWSSPDLLKVIQLFTKNLSHINKMDKNRPILSRLVSKLSHLLNANTLSGSRKNISAHYDLGNDFFELFLDPSMMYSSAIFKSRDSTLAEASTHKMDTICKKLKLKDSDHLLEIGTGWGGLAIHAVQNYGCHVTTTTISKEQHDYAKARIKALGLDKKITLLLKDYRDLSGEYDKLVSIEMIEAVGHEYYDNYFQMCNQLLKPDGLMLIQAITIADQRYLSAKKSVDFIQRYIFPGGCLPSIEVISKCTSKKSDMQIINLQDITEHYADTLHHWREAFHRNIDAVKKQGFDDIFCRMWEFYLLYCEGGFRERAISTVQVVLAKPDYRSQ